MLRGHKGKAAPAVLSDVFASAARANFIRFHFGLYFVIGSEFRMTFFWRDE